MKKIILYLLIGLTLTACSPKDQIIKAFQSKEKHTEINNKNSKKKSLKVTIKKTPLKKTETPSPVATPVTQEENPTPSSGDLDLEPTKKEKSEEERKGPYYDVNEQYKYGRPRDLKLDKNYMDEYGQNWGDHFDEETSAYLGE